MFKVEIHKGDFIIAIDSDSIVSDEATVRKLIDDIANKFNSDVEIKDATFNVNEVKLSE